MILTDELLLQYKRCHRRAFLNVYTEESQQPSEKNQFLLKLTEEREFHSQQVVENYGLPYHQPKTLTKDKENNLTLALITENLMRQGVECIYQGVIIYKVKNFIDTNQEVTFIVSPTLLIKQDIPSRWGDWSYFSVNTHLGKNIKPEYKLISGFQGDILSLFQGINLSHCQIFLRNNLKPYYLNLSIWIPASRELVKEFTLMIVQKKEPDVFISRQRCSFCQWYDDCYSLAKSQQHLSLIPGITPKRYNLLTSEGINNLENLSQAKIWDLNRILDKDMANKIYLQSQSLVSHQAILKNPTLPIIPYHPIELYFDIEAEPDRNIDYLLGVLLVNNETQEKKYYTFLAETLIEEETIWRGFLKFISQYDDAPIFHYSQYEVETIKRLAYLYKTPSLPLQSLLNRCWDLHKIIINSFYLPVENYSLKSIGNWLGFHWRDPKTGKISSHNVRISGDQCVFWYDQWLKTNDRTWLNYILVYNEDDCLGTYELKKWMDKELRVKN
ncbi:hypothetical protein GM3708_441 [Geminocystis sp. NIES-3708]|uniref:TM0106 family RecB-like putative nuclease n=1 Tax=Geminocystis sp. NIES-3708 TaxID=1615909 RepID=UPI0005FC95C3|nr:TM0106 family RecB-like putative nuclease [Geminocystis sp. NIES-3708]BAQ60035.1 hypothetical protein GM3708_441 [Geminocystis sp. NIES-3708]